MHKTIHDSETNASGQQVITACAFIHKIIDGKIKVFLSKRANTKKFRPGEYEIPGGHIDFGEDIVEGLKREINEELHVRVRIGDPFAAFTYTNPIKGSHSIEVVYFAELADQNAKIQLNPEDHSTYGWFSSNELPNAYTGTKGADDDEFIACRKGFSLLEGYAPNSSGDTKA